MSMRMVECKFKCILAKHHIDLLDHNGLYNKNKTGLKIVTRNSHKHGIEKILKRNGLEGLVVKNRNLARRLRDSSKRKIT